jgi:hypothetical protein
VALVLFFLHDWLTTVWVVDEQDVGVADPKNTGSVFPRSIKIKEADDVRLRGSIPPVPSRVRAAVTQGRGKSSPYDHDDDWCLDIYIAGRAALLRGIADEAHLNAKKIEWRTQCASTLEDAKIEVRTALKTEEDVWHTLTSVMMSF